jgi:hypothetical protein
LASNVAIIASSVACVTAANKRAFCVISRPGTLATERTTP